MSIAAPLAPGSLARWLALAMLCHAGIALAAPAAKPAGPLTVHMRSDRMTLQIAKAPQIYFAGTINSQAVQQVRDLLDSGKVSPGADVYLDSSDGDVAAGIALGKLFRTARLNTHLGTWRTGGWSSGVPARPATCLDACAYAYLGGVYRWSPSGADRIGLHEALLPDRTQAAPDAPTPEDLRAYLESMGVQPAYFAHVVNTVVNGIAWWNADAMAPWQVANNGRLPLQAADQSVPGTPKLQLTQTMRHDHNRITLQCAPDKVDLTASYGVGDARARQIVARVMYAYFGVDGHAQDKRHGDAPQVDDGALVFTRQLPFADLANVLATTSLGAWFEVSGSPVRLGFWMSPSVVAKDTQTFFAACQAMQPGYVPPKVPAAEPVKHSFWQKIFGRAS